MIWGEKVLVLMECFKDSGLNCFIIYGDVVLYNFLKINYLGIVMIDFDLLVKVFVFYDYV